VHLARGKKQEHINVNYYPAAKHNKLVVLVNGKKMNTVIKNETTGVNWTSTEVLDVKIERLHDASREQYCGASCAEAESKRTLAKKCAKKREEEASGRRTWLFLGLGGGLARDEHAGASALTLCAGRREEHAAHAGRGRRRLLERGERGRVEAWRRAEAGSSLGLARVHAPRRRRGSS
jgi:hypothetical protein